MKKFSRWAAWLDRNDLHGVAQNRIGVYALAISSKDISGEPFSMREEIRYFGMTNSLGGLKSRLSSFNRTIHGKKGHGGARRFKKVHTNPTRLVEKLYVAVSPTDCVEHRGTPKGLILMGKVAKFEYECMASYLEAFGKLPRFNRMSSAKDTAEVE